LGEEPKESDMSQGAVVHSDKTKRRRIKLKKLPTSSFLKVKETHKESREIY
jgi:hypothetical protein